MAAQVELTLADVLAACAEGIAIGYNGRLPITAVRIDSRAVQPGDLFVALPGERVDGHKFVRSAFERGARAALVSQTVDAPEGAVLVRVPHTLRALQQLAAHWRSRFSARVIGVTGSIGKTTTKELIAQVLSGGPGFNVLRNEGNQNSESSLPLNVLRLRPEHTHGVFEMGMYARGEIAALAAITKPVVGVVTKIEPVHMERLGSIENIARAKGELIEALPANGTAILNDDDELVRGLRAISKARVLTFGSTPRADVWADDITSLGLDGVTMTLHHKHESWHLRVPLLGAHSAFTVLRAAAVAVAEGMGWDEIINALQHPGEQLRLQTLEGPLDSIVLDDTYNASAESTIAALNLLDTLDHPRVAVLGEMYELGLAEEREHRMVGCRAALVADFIVCLGEKARWIADEAIACGAQRENVFHVMTHEHCLDLVRRLVTRKSVVLFKGSRGLEMENIVKQFVVRGDE